MTNNVEIIIVPVIGAISSLLTVLCVAFKNSRIKHLRLGGCFSVNQDDKSSVAIAIRSLDDDERKKELKRSPTF